MIAYIKGNFIETTGNIVVVENADGIGFEIRTSQNTIRDISGTNSQVKLYTKLCVKEDVVELYGFSTREELTFFELLITVSGIGPKGAVSILSFLTPPGLKTAIMTDNIDLIKKSPGIGLKTAQKMVIELKNKIKDIIPVNNGKCITDTAAEAYNDAVDVLEMLGYSVETVMRIINRIQDKNKKTTQEIVKEALQLINQDKVG